MKKNNDRNRNANMENSASSHCNHSNSIFFLLAITKKTRKKDDSKMNKITVKVIQLTTLFCNLIRELKNKKSKTPEIILISIMLGLFSLLLLTELFTAKQYVKLAIGFLTLTITWFILLTATLNYKTTGNKNE